ncbi:hypothetical protein CR513_43480, partial [Mucuna pruriens]
MGSNKNLLLIIVSLSSFLLSTNAVPGIFSSVGGSVSPTLSPVDDDSSIFGKALKASEQVLKTEPEVIDFCKGTENPTLCADTITPYFQSSSFDPIKALETEIKATLNQSMKVADIIAESLADASTGKVELDALDICKSQYKSIIETIKEAEHLINQQNVVDAYYKFSSVISDHSTCEDAFLESPGISIPFPRDSLIVYQLGGNCMAIMDGIVWLDQELHFRIWPLNVTLKGTFLFIKQAKLSFSGQEAVK